MKSTLFAPLAAAVCAAVLAPAAGAAFGPVDPGAGGGPPVQFRPDSPFAVPGPSAPWLPYTGRAGRFSGARAVVHYALGGPAAPPALDADEDGTPDFVERVAGAADTAIDYFESRGFTPIAPDAGGPSPAPDVYISRFETNVYGVAYPPARGEGGAFVVVSNALSDVPAGRCTGSLDATVAHELFHVVQFSYYRPDVYPALPTWIAEGSAGAIEARLYPSIVDRVNSEQLKEWFRETEQPISRQSYGAQLLWRYVDERYPRVLPAVLRELAAQSEAPSRAVVAAVFAKLTGRPFARTFHAFGLGVTETYGPRIRPLTTLAGRSAAYLGVVQPFALHYVRVRAAAGRRLVVVLRFARTSTAVRAAIVVGRSHRRVSGRATGRTVVFVVAARALGGKPALLVVSNGDAARSVNYGGAAR